MALSMAAHKHAGPHAGQHAQAAERDERNHKISDPMKSEAVAAASVLVPLMSSAHRGVLRVHSHEDAKEDVRGVTQCVRARTQSVGGQNAYP